MSDQANAIKLDKKEQSKTGDTVSAELKHPKTSEAILHTALVHKTKDFFTQYVFGGLKHARMVFYGGSLPLMANALANSSTDNLRQAGIFFGVSVGLGLVEAAKKKHDTKPVIKPSLAQGIK